MSLKDLFSGKKDKDAVDLTDSDMPVMEQDDDSLSAAARRAKRKDAEFRLRENTPEPDTHDLPSVNRKAGGNKLITVLGFVFILGAAAAMIMAVNGDKKHKNRSEAFKEKAEKIGSTLPPLVVPKDPPAITLTQPAQATPSNSNAVATGQAAPIAVQRSNGQFMNKGANGKPIPDWTDRKMGGGLIIPVKNEAGQRPAVVDNELQPQNGGTDKSEMATLLTPTVTKMASASLLPNRDFIITKGTPIDCALETALDSSLPGIATCILSRDVYSDNGKVLLLEKSTKMVGEYQSGVKRGQVRLFLLWTRAKTPNGVVINLNSVGTDALGRTGVEGWTDTHFAERFGAAILMSLLKDTVQIVAQQSTGGSGTNIYGNTSQGGEKVIEKILDSTVNIPNTIIKNQGDHIEIMVSRDLDFSSVYSLKEAE